MKVNSIETDSSFISTRADRNAGFEIDRYIIENVCTKVNLWWKDKLLILGNVIGEKWS